MMAEDRAAVGARRHWACLVLRQSKDGHVALNASRVDRALYWSIALRPAIARASSSRAAAQAPKSSVRIC
jgi:hypothetical protein